MLNLDKKQQLVFLILIFVIVVETGFIMADRLFPSLFSDNTGLELEIPVGDRSDEYEEGEKNSVEEAEEPIKVYVTGQVKKQGVVTLPQGSRWEDAVNAAGGLTDQADSLRINLAKRLSDGEAVYIPKIGDEDIPSIASPNSDGSGGGKQKININTADINTLDQLPGIGPSRAQKIIEYREENGPFKSIEDIKKITGIGEKIFENLKDDITVD
ncbi:MAG: helix-hairpin-helix domain-containing protein [Clostridia bacterium]|jgi:competence protein ComEA